MATKRKRSFSVALSATSFADLESNGTGEVNVSRKDEEDAVDRLNDLPDDLILKIMSFFTTKEVIQTSLLSKRWKDLSTYLTDIDIGDFALLKNRAMRKSFMNFVDGYLSSRKDIAVNRFRLFCRGPGMVPRRINGWIDYALQHNVRELVLNIKTRDFTVLPVEIFTSKALEGLRLCMLHKFILSVPSNCCLTNLKILCLSCLTFSDDESIRMILSSCNSLKELVIESCESSNLKKLSVWHLNLRRLTITGVMTFGHELELDTPNLVYFKYTYRTETRHSFINLNSLLEAQIDIGGSIYGRDTTPAIDLIRGINHVRSLHLTGSFADVKDLVLRPTLIPKFLNLAYLKIVGFYPGWENLVANCPHLETLAFDFWSCGMMQPLLTSTEEVPSSLVQHIKIIKLIAFQGKQIEFQLVEYLLTKAEALESLTVELKIDATKRKKRIMEKEIGEKIYALPKVSKKCQIFII